MKKRKLGKRQFMAFP